MMSEDVERYDLGQALGKGAYEDPLADRGGGTSGDLYGSSMRDAMRPMPGTPRGAKISSSELLSELRRSCTESLVNAGQRRGRRR